MGLVWCQVAGDGEHCVAADAPQVGSATGIGGDGGTGTVEGSVPNGALRWFLAGGGTER